jgi:hypothetical protein
VGGSFGQIDKNLSPKKDNDSKKDGGVTTVATTSSPGNGVGAGTGTKQEVGGSFGQIDKNLSPKKADDYKKNGEILATAVTTPSIENGSNSPGTSNGLLPVFVTLDSTTDTSKTKAKMEEEAKSDSSSTLTPSGDVKKGNIFTSVPVIKPVTIQTTTRGRDYGIVKRR